MRHWTGVFSAAAICASGAGAQEPEPMVTDRPDQTESAQTVPRGSVQFELGWTLDRVTSGAVPIHTHSAPGLLIRFGVTPRLEARAGFAGWQASGVVGVPGTTTVRGDTDLGFKYLLRSANGSGPQMALLGTLSLPTGSTGTLGGRADPSGLIAIAHQLSEIVTLSYNLGAGATTSSAGAQRATLVDLVGSVSLGIGLTPALGAFVETFGSHGVSAGGGNGAAFDAGLTFLLGNNVQLDASGGVGVGEAAQWFIGAGLSVRLPR